MKSVGIKVLKNKLSTYLNFVRQGEVVLVTDRDEVIAEIKKPSLVRHAAGSNLEAFLREASAKGELRLSSPEGSACRPPPALPKPLDITQLLDEVREERF